MSIELTKEQEMAYMKEKVEKFIIAMKKVEEETGMTIVPTIEFTQFGIVPRASVLPIKEKKNEDIIPKTA
jgi:hypothetical protein